MTDRRGLFITLSNIGDAVMTTPALEQIHQAMPEALIDIVADRRSSQLFQYCPYRGEILLREKGAGWRGLIDLVGRLRRRRYSVIADLRTDGLSYVLHADRRLLKRHARNVTGHAVMRHLAVVAPLPPRLEPIRTRLWLGPAERAHADAVLSRLPPGRWLALGPGANWPPKIWPPGHFAALVELVSHRFSAVIVCGGPGDAGTAAALTRCLPLPAINLAGTTDLLQAAAILERSASFVGNDSGLGHMAAAVGTPTLTVFGPGDPDRYHPWGPRADWLLARGRDLAALTPDEVATRLDALLARPGPAGESS
jgi:ADP-heptose:LPS heptosyltransferase